MKPVVLVGHAHHCPLHGPGKVITGAAAFSSDGRPVARVGDKTCCGATIVSGDASFIIDGQPIACVGDTTDHGGTLVEGTPYFVLGMFDTSPTHRAFDNAPAQAPLNSWDKQGDTTHVPPQTGQPAHSPPCEPARRFTCADVRVIRSYDTIKQLPLPIPPGTPIPAYVEEARQKVVNALNRAAQALEEHEKCEHINLLGRVAIYLSVDQVASSKAFVSRPPVYDVVFNAVPFRDLWEGHRVGVVLHELHHFSAENLATYERQVADGSAMGPGTSYEEDCDEFQASLGFPAHGYYDFDNLAG